MSNTTPEELEQIEIAMRGVHASAAQLDHFAAKRFVGREIKFALAVVTKIRRRELAGLQAIRANNPATGNLLHDQMIAEFVERIDIQTGRVRLAQSFAQFEVKNLKPQLLGATHFVCVGRQSGRV